MRKVPMGTTPGKGVTPEESQEVNSGYKMLSRIERPGLKVNPDTQIQVWKRCKVDKIISNGESR